MIFSKNKGFTLIELLVVVAIIGILASVVLASLNSARIKTRDAARKSTLRQVQKSLELYFNANGSYPTTSGTYYSSEPGDNYLNGPANNGIWIPGLAPTYITALPRDPIGGSSAIAGCGGTILRAYIYVSDGANYKLFAHCSPEGAILPTDTFHDPV